MSNRFQVKAVNDDESFCECCGRQGLKRVVWIEDTETQEVRHYGVICAQAPAKAFGLVKEIKAAVRLHEKQIEEAARKARNEAAMRDTSEKLAELESLYRANMGTWNLFTFSNGRTGEIPDNPALWSALHSIVFAR